MPEQSLDWTGDEPTAKQERPTLGDPYDPSKDREEVRGRIAVWLLYTLVGIVAALFLTVWLKLAPMDDIFKLVTVVLTPIIGVFGAVTGFYFGTGGRQGKG